MLFSLQMQMEDQQAEMVRLRETTALEKDAAARIQTRLIKQVDTLRKSQSNRTAEERAHTLSSSQHDRESAQSTDNSKRYRSETGDEDERSRTQNVLEPEVLSH